MRKCFLLFIIYIYIIKSQSCNNKEFVLGENGESWLKINNSHCVCKSFIGDGSLLNGVTKLDKFDDLQNELERVKLNLTNIQNELELVKNNLNITQSELEITKQTLNNTLNELEQTNQKLNHTRIVEKWVNIDLNITTSFDNKKKYRAYLEQSKDYISYPILISSSRLIFTISSVGYFGCIENQQKGLWFYREIGNMENRLSPNYSVYGLEYSTFELEYI